MRKERKQPTLAQYMAGAGLHADLPFPAWWLRGDHYPLPQGDTPLEPTADWSDEAFESYRHRRPAKPKAMP